MLYPNQQQPLKQGNPTTPFTSPPYLPPPAYVHAVPTQLIAPQTWQQPRHVRQSALKRFLKALGFALFFWVAFSMFFGGIFNMFPWGGDWPWPTHPSPSPNYPFPPDTDAGECHYWQSSGHHHDGINDYPYASSTSFELPIDAAALFIKSAGWAVGGHLTVEASPDVQNAHIDVEIHYYRTEARDKAQACLLRRGDNEHGVGVIVEDHWRPHRREDKVYFVITATLPESSIIHSFETDLHNFVQKVDDISTRITFEKINLKTTNAPINVGGVTADEGVFRSSNGPIHGEFYTDRFLQLHTSNSAVEANVFLANDVRLNRNTTLDVKSSNGKISVATSLHTKGSEEGGYFEVNATTSNSPISLLFLHAPVKSTLHTSAISTNSPVNVHTHPTYQGSFELSTTNMYPFVERNGDGRNDPEGRGRTRTTHTNSIGRSRYAVGETYWSREEATGRVTIRSTNSPVVLSIQ